MVPSVQTAPTNVTMVDCALLLSCVRVAADKLKELMNCPAAHALTLVRARLMHEQHWPACTACIGANNSIGHCE